MKFLPAKDHLKLTFQFIFTAFAIGLAIWFFYHEKDEISDIGSTLHQASIPWLIAGLVLVLVYIMLQAEMYRQAFKAVGAEVSLFMCGLLFLKRNLISIFIPAGGISSLAFFSKDIEKQGVSNSKVTLASSIYGFVGILTVIIVAIPAFIYALFVSSLGAGEWVGLALTLLIAIALLVVFRSIRSQGGMYDWLIRKVPQLQAFLAEIAEGHIQKKHFVSTIFFSLLIELTGIAHLYIAMHALHTEKSLFACVMGYIVAVIFMLISPFLRGMGAVELSMGYLLSRFGLPHSEAVSITLLFRFYEFWLPLLAGLLAFLLPVQRLILRILPALFLMLLGAVNMLSALTPAIRNRIKLLEHFIPIELVSASNYLVFAAGVFLIFTSVFLFKGLKNAWYFAVGLAAVSGLGHLTKGYDFEESLLALIVVAVLFLTRKQYNVHSSRKLGITGFWMAMTAVVFTLLYGVIGFYLLDKHHFGIDFSLRQSVNYALQTFFLVDTDLIPKDTFGHSFLNSIRLLGFSSLLFFLYTLVKPYLGFIHIQNHELDAAKEFMKTAGTGSLDYFKTYSDKSIFWSGDKSAFLAYRIAGMYAVVLETPVAMSDLDKSSCILEFDRFCYQSGLKSVYYRVNERDLKLFPKKKKLFLGQEAIVDISDYSLEGGHKKVI
jgi:phosphatidylglycerol lysyltransferase